MNYLKNIKGAFKEVYGNRGYFLLTFLMASVLFSLNSLVRNYKLVFSSFSFSLLFSLIKGTFTSFSFPGLVSLIIISILAGVVFSFSFFLLRRQISSGASVGTPGIIIAILSPACPSCAIGLFSVVGLGGLFTFLPFGGLELGFISIVILVVSIGYLSNKIVTKVCEINKSRDYGKTIKHKL